MILLGGKNLFQFNFTLFAFEQVKRFDPVFQVGCHITDIQEQELPSAFQMFNHFFVIITQIKISNPVCQNTYILSSIQNRVKRFLQAMMFHQVFHNLSDADEGHALLLQSGYSLKHQGIEC